MWICQNCGTENGSIGPFCMNCGSKRIMPDPARPGSSGNSYNLSNNSVEMEIKKYLRPNKSADTMDIVGNIFLILSAIIPILLFLIIGLSSAITIFISLFICGYLLKALSKIWQNTENTNNLLRFFVEYYVNQTNNK